MFSNSDARVDGATPHLIREIGLISAGFAKQATTMRLSSVVDAKEIVGM
jgi:hypothetical protein